MITLKQMAIAYDGFMDDMAIIQQYIVETNQEQLALRMIPALAAAETKKIKAEYDYAKLWVLTIPNLPIKNEEKKDKLNDIIKHSIFDVDLNSSLLEWAKENIPQMKVPKLFFMPAVYWLNDKYGIKFKDYDYDKMKDFGFLKA